MNIVYFTPHLREASGINRVLSIKANYLADVLKYNVTVITYRQHQSVILFPFSESVKLIHLDLEDPTFRLTSLSFIEKRRQLKHFMNSYKNLVTKYLLEHKTDICISLFLGAEYKFLSEINDGSKKVLEFHMSFEHSPFRLFIEDLKIIRFRSYLQLFLLRTRLRNFDQIIVLTKGDAQNWQKHFRNITVIGNPVTISAPATAPALTNKTAIAVGRLEREKGFDLLITAWRTVNQQHPDWTLNIFGEGNLEADLRRQIIENGLERAVRIYKTVPNINDKFHESSVFVLSSRNEGFGLVLLEAMASGIPAVSFECKYGPAEIIEDGRDGFLVELGNTQRLAEHIIALIEDEKLRKAFSANAMRSAQRFALRQMMTRWDDLFESLV